MVTKIWITLRKCERRRKERWPRKLELHCENVSGRGRNGGHENLDWNTTGSGYESIILILILIRFLGEKLEERNGSNVQVEVL